MSAASAWVWNQTVITTTKPRKGRKPSPPRADRGDKLVLLAIAEQVVTGHDWSALLPLDYLLSMVGGEERSLYESLERLEAAGYIRRHRTLIINGRERTRGWSRFYLLAPQSPVVQGVITVNWSVPEKLSESEYRKIQQLQAAQKAAAELSTSSLHQVQGAPPDIHNAQVNGYLHQVHRGLPAPGAGPRSEASCTRCRKGGRCNLHQVHVGPDQANVDELPAPGAGLPSICPPSLTTVKEGVSEGGKGDRAGDAKRSASPAALGILARLPWTQNPHGVGLTSVIQDELGPDLDALMREDGRSAEELQKGLSAPVKRVRSQTKAVSYLRQALTTLPRPLPLGEEPDAAITVRGECANKRCTKSIPVRIRANGDAIPTLCAECVEHGESLPASAANA